MAFDPSAVVRDYGDPVGEAVACRTSAAVFDFSFMARGRVRGAGAIAAIASLTGRAVADMRIGTIRYAVRCDEAGHLAAALTIWRTGHETFEVMSGRPVDIGDLVAAMPEGEAADLSGETAVIAVQGPRSLAVLETISDGRQLRQLAYFGCCETEIGGAPALVGRLGYTGEKGFEIVVAREARERIWSLIAREARPAGFAAADILRIEAGLVLFVNEFRLGIRPEEAGLARFAGLSDTEGEKPRPDGDALRLVAFTAGCAATEPVLWQPGVDLRRPREGEIAVTSAAISPEISGIAGLGYVLDRTGSCDPHGPQGTATSGPFLIDPRGIFGDIRLLPLPFYDPRKQIPRGPWP